MSTRVVAELPDSHKRDRVLRVVERVRSSPGTGLDPDTRHRMQAHFGRDFSHVRVHTDSPAAASAHAIGARAYTVGHDVVFGADQFAPHTVDGSALLAHELAHVAQQSAPNAGRSLELDDPGHAVEHEAARAVRDGRVTELSRGNVIHRSLLGGAVGGLLGAAGGALLGGLAGGPIGAVVGGIVGLVVGAAVGEDVTTKGRALTNAEITYAREVFLDSLDYTKIRITRDSIYATGAPRTLGNTIHLKSSWGHFVGDGLELTDEGKLTLIHEMTHVWQYQNGGLAYIPESLIAQLGAVLGSGDRGGAYDWRAAHKEKKPWAKWNPEQQAAAVEDYNRLLRKSKDKTATVAEIAELAVLTTYMRFVWSREGAPDWSKKAD